MLTTLKSITAVSALLLITVAFSCCADKPTPLVNNTTVVDGSRFWTSPESGVEPGDIWDFRERIPRRVAQRPHFVTFTTAPHVNFKLTEQQIIDASAGFILPSGIDTRMRASRARLVGISAGGVAVSRLESKSIDQHESVSTSSQYREAYNRVCANSTSQFAAESVLDAIWTAKKFSYSFQVENAADLQARLLATLPLGFDVIVSGTRSLEITYDGEKAITFQITRASQQQLPKLWIEKELIVNTAGRLEPRLSGPLFRATPPGRPLDACDCELDVDGDDVPTYTLSFRLKPNDPTGVLIECRFEAREDPDSGNTIAGHDWRIVARGELPAGAGPVRIAPNQGFESLISHTKTHGWHTWAIPAKHIAFHAGFSGDGPGDDCHRLEYAVGIRAKFLYASRP